MTLASCRLGYAHAARPYYRIQLLDGHQPLDLRKNYEEAEANAIGTEYVRADLNSDKRSGGIAGRAKELS